jgi:hypothetical protein
MQRHVDPRGNTGRRHQITVDEAFIPAHIDGRIEFGEQVEPSPVSRSQAAAEDRCGSPSNLVIFESSRRRLRQA